VALAVAAAAEAAADAEASPAAARATGRLTCQSCGLEFETRAAQAAHFALAWHRVNLRRRAAGQAPLPEAEATAAAAAAAAAAPAAAGGDAAWCPAEPAAAAGPPSDDDENDDDDANDDGDATTLTTAMAAAPGYGAFVARGDRNFAVCLCRSLLPAGDDAPAGAAGAAAALRLLANPDQRIFTVLLVRSGRFAGAVFDGDALVAHKAFARCVEEALLLRLLRPPRLRTLPPMTTNSPRLSPGTRCAPSRAGRRAPPTRPARRSPWAPSCGGTASSSWGSSREGMKLSASGSKRLHAS